MAQPGVVAPWRATYVPGEWYLISGPTSLVVLGPGSGRGDMITELWADVVASSSMTDLVDRLAGYGITELPELAVVFWSAAGMRTLVRGGIRVVDARSGQQVATGEDVVTWSEVGLDKLTSVSIRLRDESADGEGLPLAVGVVRAGGISLSAEEEAVVRSPQPLLRTAARLGGSQPAGALQGLQEDHQPGQSVRLDDADTEQDRAPADELAGTAAAAVGTPQDDRAGSERAVDDSGPDFPPIDSDDDGGSQTGESPTFGIDSPWGPQAGSGPVGSGPVDSGPVGSGPVGSGPVGSGPVGGGPVGSGPVGVDGGVVAGGAVGGAVAAGGFVGGVVGGGAWPSAGSGAASGRSSGSPTEFSLEQFEMENDDTELIAGPEVGGPTGPLVEAVRCPNGHANAPGSTGCRVCGSPITAHAPESIPEPLLARLRAADGTIVDLDRPVLLGRAPSEQRSTVPLPRLVTLASPAQDISRTHVQLVPENWQVMVTDLNSTNGTFVTDPGPSGNRGLLPPGQPTPVPIGAVLELGEGVTVTVEPGD